MKKLIAIFLICFILTTETSHAFVPVIIPAWYLGTVVALFVTGTAAGMYYAMKPTASTITNLDGSLARAASVAYIAATAGANALNEHDLTTSMSYDQVSTLSEKKDSSGNYLYPGVYAATHGKPLAPELTGTSPIGVVAHCGSLGNKMITGLAGVYDPDGGFTGGGASLSGAGRVCFSEPSRSYSGQTRNTIYYYEEDTRPPQLLPGPNAAVNLSANRSASGPVVPSLQGELDHMMQDPSYVPTFTDDTTGLPYVPPIGVLTPEQVKAANDAGVAHEAQTRAQAEAKAAAQAAQAAAGATVSAAQSAAAAAQTAASNAAASAAANPADAALQQKAKDAAAAAAAATAALTSALAEKAKVDAQAAEADVPYDSETTGTLHKFNWEALKQLKNVLTTTFPFNLLPMITTLLNRFVSEPTAPQFDLPVYGSTVMHVSLAIFDPVAAVSRYLIAVLLSIGAIQLIVGFWRGN